MIHLDSELEKLKNSLLDMWSLVKSQVDKSKLALVNKDKDLAREITAIEKKVNSFELSIDADAENIFALLNPVAIDLRFVLSVIKINNNLERIGDFADGIAKLTIQLDPPFDEDLLKAINIDEMFFQIDIMLNGLTEAFTQEDGILARQVFKRDEELDVICENSTKIIADFITQNPGKITEALNVFSVVRKLERVGDHSKNIAEEIVFYLEAKVLKHKKNPAKIKKS